MIYLKWIQRLATLRGARYTEVDETDGCGGSESATTA
jgi:hypothetical protein